MGCLIEQPPLFASIFDVHAAARAAVEKLVNDMRDSDPCLHMTMAAGVEESNWYNYLRNLAWPDTPPVDDDDDVLAPMPPRHHASVEMQQRGVPHIHMSVGAFTYTQVVPDVTDDAQ